MKNKLQKKAFTLVEALVVLLIISALAAILFVFLPDDASNTGVDSDIYAIRRGVYMTVLEHGNFGSDITEFAGWLNQNLDNELVFKPSDDELLSDAKDPWGTRYRILIQGKAAQISSAGENRRFDDEDDFSVLIYYRTIDGRIEVFVKEDNSLSLVDAGGTGAGLFDINNDLLASWTTLVNDYGLTVSGYSATDSPIKRIMANNPSLTEGVKLVVADGVTSLGDYAFAGSTLTKVILPEGLTNMGNYTFSSSGNLTYAYLPESLSSIGNSSFANCTSLSDIVIPDDVTSIGNSAFENCASLALIDLPKSLVYLGDASFKNCVSAAEILFNDRLKSIGEEAFASCVSVTDVEIPASTEEMGEDCFAGCASLETLKLQFVGNKESTSLAATSKNNFGYIFGGNSAVPDTLKTVSIENGNIASSAFKGCSSIEKVTVSETLSMVGEKAFEGCSSLKGFYAGEGLTFIGDYAFNACTSMTEIEYTNSVTNIGEYAFKNAGLLSVDIPTGISNIKEGTFYQCTSLSSITIPYYVQTIGDYAFYGCSRFTSVEVPNSVVSIGLGAFGSCTGLTSMTIPFAGQTGGGATNTHFSYILGGDISNLLPGLKTVVLTGAYDIPDQAFKSCSDIQTVKITGNAKAIGNEAFLLCSSLENIEIGPLVETVGDYAFSECNSLESVVVPSSVKEIGFAAFGGSNSIESIDLPFIGGNAVPLNDHSRLFGYIFGSVSGLQISQQYFDGPSGYNTEVSFRIPNDLSKVTIRGAVGEDAMGFYFGGSQKELVTVVLEEGANIASYAFRTPVAAGGIRELKWNGDMRVYDYGFANSKFPKLTIANGITEIPDGAFSGNTVLKSVSIPSSVTKIGDDAFAGCTAITSVTLTSGLLSIGERAFNGCTGLTSITIPSTVSFIGKNAFLNSSLSSATFKAQDGWFYSPSIAATSGTNIAQSSLANKTTAATYLKSTLAGYFWKS